jgi:hypothetical protein
VRAGERSGPSYQHARHRYEFGLAQHLLEVDLATSAVRSTWRCRAISLIEADADGPGTVGPVVDELTIDGEYAVAREEPVQILDGIVRAVNGHREEAQLHAIFFRQ